MFFKKEDKKEDIPLSKIGSLLIHAAKIDEHYSNEEEEIIKKTLISLGANKENIDFKNLRKYGKVEEISLETLFGY